MLKDLKRTPDLQYISLAETEKFLRDYTQGESDALANAFEVDGPSIIRMTEALNAQNLLRIAAGAETIPSFQEVLKKDVKCTGDLMCLKQFWKFAKCPNHVPSACAHPSMHDEILHHDGKTYYNPIMLLYVERDVL